MTRKIFVVFISLALIFGAALPGAFPDAVAADIIATGSCGENVTYTLDSDGLLTISGSGEMEKSGYYDYSASIRNVIIEHGVTSIREYAFLGYKVLTSVSMSDSVTTIGESAFSGCTGLTSLTISDSVTSIGSAAFSGCTGLTSLTISDSVTSIGSSAFYGCTGLTSLTIPAGVTSLSGAFSGCSGLERIEVSEDNPTYHSAGNCLIETETKTLELGCNNSVIPDDGSVTSIPNGAFWRCAGLTSIKIPAEVTEIGGQAFWGCSGLVKIEVAEENPNYYSYGDCLIDTKYGRNTLLLGCKNSILPDDGSLDSIGSDAFCGCSGLSSIIIPDSVTNIGDSAFSGCTGLTSITIPDSVKKIGRLAFYGCSGIEKIEISANNTEYHSAGNCLIETGSKRLVFGCKNSVIPDDGSVLSISDNAFVNCADLKNIIIPDCVSDIGANAFRECSGLISISIDGVKRIEYGIFYGCTGLKSLTIGKSVTFIDYNAFSGCAELEKIEVSEDNTVYHSSGNCLINTVNKNLVFGCKNSVIPDDGSVEIIGRYAFGYCTGLTQITIPGTVTGIGHNAFRGCTGLTQVIIPESVTDIGESAFLDCTGLESIVIPPSVTYIYDSDAIPRQTLIIGVVGSYAEQWAKEHNRKFKDISEIDVGQDPGGQQNVDPAEGLVSNDTSRAVVDAAEKQLTVLCGVTADELKDLLSDDALTIVDVNGNVMDEGQKIGTGARVITGSRSIPDETADLLSRLGLTIDSIPELNEETLSVFGVTNDDLAALLNPVGDGSSSGTGGEEYTVIVPGDLNSDGEITAADARTTLRMSAKLEDMPDVFKSAADVLGGDDNITAADARKILRVSARLEDISLG